MAILRSSEKDMRRIAKRTARNRQVRSRLKTLRRKLDEAIASGNAEEAKTAAVSYTSALDKAAKRRIIHQNKADRHKSGYARVVNS